MTNTEIRNQYLYDYTGLMFDTWDASILKMESNDKRLNGYYIKMTEDLKKSIATPERILFIALTTVIEIQEDNIGRNDGYWYFIHPTFHKDRELLSQVAEFVKNFYKTIFMSNEYLVTGWEAWKEEFEKLFQQATTNDFIFDVPYQKIVVTVPNNSMKYEVVVVPNNGDKTKETYIFENLNPLMARRAAIAKAKELESANERFNKDTGYHVLIIFHPEKDEMFKSILYGDSIEETKEALQSEADRFDRLGLEFETTALVLDEEEEDSDEIDVTAEDFDYLMS